MIDDRVRLVSEVMGQRVHGEEIKPGYTMQPGDDRGERLREYWWKPGESGNPKGRLPKNLSIVSLIKDLLTENPEDAKAIAKALISMAKREDMRAIEEMLNRVDGKVVETHKIEGELPIRLIFVPANQVIGQIVEGEVKELTEGENEQRRSS